jgi:signal transduction histidine kinase
MRSAPPIPTEEPSGNDGPVATAVLVVDDEPNIGLLVQMTLADHGYKVDAVDSVTLALARLEAEDYSIVLTDLRMPVSSGIDLLRWIRERRPRTGVILMTGYASLDTAAEGLRLVARDYLLKPFASLDLVVNSVRRVEAEQRLEAEASLLRQRLAHADRLAAIGEHAAGVAHEIANPAALIASNTELLLSALTHASAQRSRLATGNGDGDDMVAMSALLDTAEQLARENDQALRRITAIVRELQSFARRDDDELASVDVNAVVRSALTIVAPQIGKRARIIEQLGDIPSTRGHAGKLTQVFVNLLSNAQHAILQSEREGRIVITTGRVDDELVCTVEDNGCGMRPEVRDRIFDAFYTTKRRLEGTGIGLAIVRQILTAHGASIAVQSREGEGSTFTIRLPLQAAVARKPSSKPPTSELPARPRVLVVDDEAVLLRAVRRMLDPAFEVETAGDGKSALAAIDARPFDVVLCDLSMPEMDGAELFARIAADRPMLAGRIIFISGGALSEGARALWESGEHAVVSKPFRKDELIAAIERALA